MKNQLRKMLTAILLTAAVCISQSTVFAQTVKPIKFAKGATSATVTGIRAGKIKHFTFFH